MDQKMADPSGKTTSYESGLRALLWEQLLQ
ncbi:MAG: hypothetical protein ACI91Z_001265, partial [Yoonia sp.]